MSLVEILLLSPLLLVSMWIGYLSYRLLRVTEKILEYTIHLDSLTQAIVANTSMPLDMASS